MSNEIVEKLMYIDYILSKIHSPPLSGCDITLLSPFVLKLTLPPL